MKYLEPWKKFVPLLMPIIIWCVYSGIFINGRLRVTPYNSNYFKELAISFSQGRLDIIRPFPWAHDLVFFEGKHYLYWPPVPALVYMPFTALYGKDTPDSVISNSFGALNVLLLIILLCLFSKRYDIKLSNAGIIFLAVFWGLGTVHFYMSMMGSVWYISQIMAQTFLMLAVIFILVKTSSVSLFLSGLFYALAVYTKNDLLFSIFLIAAIYITGNEIKDKKVLKRNVMLFLASFIAFSLANMWYNLARFGNVFENGVKYHQMAPYFLENFKKHGYLSLHYVPYNFTSEVIAPPLFIKQFPFFKFSPKGFGFFWASPVFVFIFAAGFYYINEFKKHLTKQSVNTVFSRSDIIVMSGAAISGITTAFLIFTVMGNGWVQFASRYSLDYQLMMVLFGVFTVKIWNNNKIIKALLIILLLFSIHMNYFGMRQYLRYENRNDSIFTTTEYQPFELKECSNKVLENGG